MYFDEVEVCNPLGAQKSIHKLGDTIMNSNDLINYQLLVFFKLPGMFYYTIGNIRPELRSTQRAIQLIACVTSKNIEKYGYQAILKPFIDDVNKLARVSYLIPFL